MPTIRTGAVATGGTNALNPDQLVVDMFEDVFQYDPPESPLMTIVTKRLQVKAARATEVKHLEDDVVPEWDTLTTTITAGATALIVSNPQYHRPGDILKFPTTGETARVTAVNEGTSTLTVLRSWGATAAAAVAAPASFINLGAAEMEGDLSPQAKTTVTVTKSNYLQIFKEPVHVTRTLENVDNYGGNERLRQRRKAGAKHARDMEQVCLHGEKNLDTASASNPIRSAGGLDEHITTNVLAAGGTLLQSEFNKFVGDCMRFSVRPGRKRKLLLCSRPMMATISGWGESKLETNSAASATYGIQVTTLITPFGTLDIINHPLLENGYEGYGYIIDPDGIWYRPARRTKLETNIQANGEDAWKDQFLTEATYTFALEKCFGKITGVVF